MKFQNLTMGGVGVGEGGWKRERVSELVYCVYVWDSFHYLLTWEGFWGPEVQSVSELT